MGVLTDGSEVNMFFLQNKITLKEGTPQRGPEFYRTLLVGLSIDCPMGKKADTCQLRTQRLLSFEEKLSWALSLTDENVMKLYLLHHNCFHTK